MLLIDGVRYEEWTPKKEVEEFQPIIKEHHKDIFGYNSFFIDGNRLESEAGKGSIPDGFVVITDNPPQWHVLEVELSTHQLYDHIVNQVGRFINGIQNSATQKKVIETIYHHILENNRRKAEFEEAIGSGEIYKFVTDVVSKQPILTIIIEKRTRELDESLSLLRYSPIKIVEFQTYKRIGAETVHAHIFEQLYQPNISSKPTITALSDEIVEIKLHQDSIASYYIDIPSSNKALFPNFKTTVELETNMGLMEIGFNPAPWGTRLQNGFAYWFKAHPELVVGDIVHITVIEPMKRYRLELLK